MRFLILWTLLAAIVAAWSSEDIELFQLQTDLVKLYGSDATFYKFFELPKGEKSTFEQISKQFKKLSKKYHPDKARGISKKKANKRFEMLNLVANVLKTDRKERYDYFLQNGFPKYSTSSAGWIYARFKPGLIFTLLVLLLFINVSHYVGTIIQRNQDRKRINSLIEEVKLVAGSQAPNGELDLTQQRKVRIERLEKTFLSRIDGVFLCDDEDPDYLEKITSDDILNPTWRDILLVRWFACVWNRLFKSVYFIDLSPPALPKKQDPLDLEEKKAKKKKKPTGEKKVLPNGKVIYSKKRN